MSGKIRNPARRCKICGGKCKRRMRYCKLCDRERKREQVEAEKYKAAGKAEKEARQMRRDNHLTT